jgi:hypothetical protein
MRQWRRYSLGLALLAGLTSHLQAQDGGLGAPPPPTIAAAPAAPPTNNLWSFLCPTPEQTAACKAKLCATPIVQLMSNSLAPASAFTGGIIGSCCPTIDPADLLKDPGSAEGAAALVKKDEADAKKRREAIRYLATADCHFWPEAKMAIINALRRDKNECVRLEAAIALGTGCCCNRETIRALTLTVSCSDEDGAPIDCSMRVKAAAAAALDHCLCCFVDVVKVPVVAEPVQEAEKDGKTENKGKGTEKPDDAEPIKKGPKEEDKSKGPMGSTGVNYYKRVGQMSRERILDDGHRALALFRNNGGTPTLAATGGHSLFEIFQAAAVPHNMPMKAVSDSQPMVGSAPPVSPIPVTAPMQQPVVHARFQTPPAAPVVGPPPTLPGQTVPASYVPSAPATVSPWRQSAGQTPVTPTSPGPPAPFPQAVKVTMTTKISSQPAAPSSVPVQGMPVRPPQLTPIESVPALILQLKTATQPEERVAAAQHLMNLDRLTPEAAHALLAGTGDASPAVRVVCLRGLSLLDGRHHPAVQDTLARLRNDPDPAVRQEVQFQMSFVKGSAQ